jgi:hypothetical protein
VTLGDVARFAVDFLRRAEAALDRDALRGLAESLAAIDMKHVAQLIREAAPDDRHHQVHAPLIR